MAGGSEIKNELTLDVDRFTQGLERATKKLDSLNSRMDVSDAKSTKLEKSIQNLSSNVEKTAKNAKSATTEMGGFSGNLDKANESTKKASQGSKRLSNDLSVLAKAASESHVAMNSMSDWTKFYGKSLDNLRPKMDAIITSKKNLASITAKTSKVEAKAIQSGIQGRIKDLSSEKSANSERIKARKAMISQLEQIERRANSAMAFAHADAFKVGADGKESRRYIGKNSGRHNELMAEIDSYKKQADMARQQKVHISAIVGEMTYRNGELNKAIRAEQSLLNVNKHVLGVERQRKVAAKALADDKKRQAQEEKQLLKELEAEQTRVNRTQAQEDRRLAQQRKAESMAEKQRLKERRQDVIAAVKAEEAERKRAARETALAEKETKRQTVSQEKALQREAAAESKRLSREKALAEKQAAKEVLQAQREAHKQRMAMHHEEMSYQREMVAFATGAAAVSTAKNGIHKGAEYQDVQDRLNAYNYSADDNQQIMDRVDALTKNNKFLSRTEALQGNIDAISALAHNDPKYLDATLETVMKDAFILKAKGYDSAELSDIVKNLYAAIEKRGFATSDYSNESLNTSDLMRRMVVASGGKVRVADLETVMNNAGQGPMTITDDGWLRLLPLIEQTKTAGGGNGGGGGVARVGTLIKMLQLMGSGRKLTNRAALDFLGADMMNEVYANGASQDFGKIAETNNIMSKALVFAGFKNQDQIAKDPAAAIMGMRGGIIDYMMRDDKFKSFWGANAQKHTYNDKGRMIGADGIMLDKRTQNEKEMAALLRFFATSGISNNNVTGMMTMMNTAYQERAEHSVATAKNSKGRDELIQDLSNNWNQSIIELKAQLTNLAVSFEPLLTQLTKIPQFIANITSKLTEFSQEHNGIATVALAFAGVKLASLLLLAPLRLLMGIFSKGGNSVFTFKGALGGLASVFSTISGKSKATAQDIGNVGASTSTAGQATKRGFSAMLSGASSGVIGVKGAVGGILRVLGLMVSWVGWIALGAMFFNVMAKWVGDIQVGGASVSQHISNLMTNIGTTIASTINNARLSFWTFLDSVIEKTNFISRRIANVNADIKSAENNARTMTVRTEQQNVEIVNKGLDHYDNIQKGYGHTVVKKWVSGSAANGDVPASAGGYQNVAVPNKGRALTEAESAERIRTINTMISKNYVFKNGRFVSPAPVTKPKVEALKPHEIEGNIPTPSHLRGPDAPLPEFERAGRGGSKAKGEQSGGRQEFTPQNAYDASMASLREENFRDSARLNELAGISVNYDNLAKEAFVKEWMTGKLDDGRDPTQRKFANRAYSKGVNWTRDDIDWNNQQVQDWVGLKSGNLKSDGTQKALEFASGKLGEATEGLSIAFDEWNRGTKVPSATQTARKQFARFEAKDPTATSGAEYEKYKEHTLSYIASTNYAETATELREKNKELHDSFLEDETQAVRNAEQRRWEAETNKVKAVIDSMDEQVKIIGEKYGTEHNLYKELIHNKEEAEGEFTKFLAHQDKLRVKNTQSAYDQTMTAWRDLENNLNQVLASFGERAGTDIWDIITGAKKLDIRGYAADMTREIGGSLFKQVWANASKFVMGEGASTNVMDMLRDFAGGKELSNDGWIGRFINGQMGENGKGGIMSTVLGKAQGWLGKILGTKGSQATELTGDQATNANTFATNSLTQAMNNLAIRLGFKNTPVALPGEQAPSGVEIVPYQDRVAVDPTEGGGGGFFSNVFNSIKTGFGKLFSPAGALMNGIGTSFGSMFSGLGSLIGGVFGKSGGKVGGVLSGAIQGGVSGGWMGAAMGGISALFNANGNAFGKSGVVHAFANGGAFTNEVYNSPTMFKFANGGQFGVMGEAGPEAVMPLQRDGSGRLGVAVNGGLGGSQPIVNISIEVNNNGGDVIERTTGDTRSDWASMSNKVRSVVQDEIVKQKRAGGMLR